jgi:DNA repair protein RecN (Recombination protein N)
VGEIDAARIEGPDEEDRLEGEEDVLADATAHREAGTAAYLALAGDEGAADRLRTAVAVCSGRRPFAELEDRLRGLVAETSEAAADLRRATEAIVIDPDRLEEVRSRRRLLADLRRKYGERLSDVLDFEIQTRARLAELEQHGERARVLEQERAEAGREVAHAATAVAAARRKAAPRLAGAVETRLHSLAMAGARFEVAVDGRDPADDVTFLLGANRGEATLPLAKVASGGELARAMLALRLALGGDQAEPSTLVFDEVDAGIGGQAALAVGTALAALAGLNRQVLVVTHLPQVAAFADHQVAVTKAERGGRTVADAKVLSDEDRVIELSRMLSGQPGSTTARDHAQELLATASRQKAARP